jgi:DNA-binding response OmpR family regulator
MNEGKKDTVLIVEDAGGFRDIYRTVLEAEEYEVLEAEDGKQGLELAAERKPDMILLDLVLPEIGGFQVLEQLRADEETKSIPVIVLSVLGERKSIQKALELGADDYTIKGAVSPREVLNKIRLVLARSNITEKTETYSLSIREGRDDAVKLERHMGVAKLLECSHCNGRMLLELMPDPNRKDEHVFTAHFVCSSCGRIS